MAWSGSILQFDGCGTKPGEFSVDLVLVLMLSSTSSSWYGLNVKLCLIAWELTIGHLSSTTTNTMYYSTHSILDVSATKNKEWKNQHNAQYIQGQQPSTP